MKRLSKTNKSIILSIVIAAATILFITQPTHGQVSIQAGAGIAYQQTATLAGQLAVSYQYKKLESSFNMLSLPFKKPTYFGITTGVKLESGEWSLKPYIGANYKLTGSNKSQDRYLHNGTVTTFSTNGEVNKFVPSFGMQIVKGVGYIDAGFMENFFVAVGLRYTFNKE